MGAPAPSLPPLEVAVRGRRAALPALQHIGIHAETHRAAGVAPLEPRVPEHPVQAFPLRLRFHLLRARDHHRAHARRDATLSSRAAAYRSEEHTSELQSRVDIS